jgi:xylulokinase
MGAASPGKVVISLGTSDTLFAAMPAPRTDPNGFGHVFGNPAGGYMSLICFKNGSLAREAIKEKYGLSWESFEKDALSQTPAGNNGAMMLPFYEPEITPAIDTEGPVFSSEHHYSSDEAVRAVLESQFLNMRTHSDWLGVSPSRIFITGGASENDGIAQVIANIFGVPVDRLDVPGSATIGAGMRAALGLGEDLDKLESKFSQPKKGRTLEPDPTACHIYNEVLPKYKAFLAEQFTS